MTPIGQQTDRAFSVIDAIANSVWAGSTYLGATALGASADTRDGLTLAAGQLAQIGASFILPRTGISPMFGETIPNVQTKKQNSANGANSAAVVTSEGTANIASRAKLADDLAATMIKPTVTDTKLSVLMDDLYRDGAKIGSGNTADAVRYETATGTPVGNVFHSQKAQDYSVALQKWLDANPAASFSDRSAAKNVLRDLQNSLRGK